MKTSHPEPPEAMAITVKRRNKAKYLTLIYRNIEISNIESLGYIKYYSSSRVAPDPLNALAILLDTAVRRLRRPRTILEIRRKGYISPGDQQSYYFQIFQRFY